MDADLAFIKAVLTQENAFNIARQENIVSSMLIGEGQKAWDILSTHYIEHGELMSEELLFAKYGIALPDEADGIKTLVSELRGRAIYEKAKGLNEELVSIIENKENRHGRINDIVPLLTEFMNDIHESNIGGHKIGNLLALGPDVLALYDRMKAGERGIQTPWKHMNDATLGLWPGDVMAIVARSGVGKTWTLVQMARQAWFDGKKVLFIGTEMSRISLARRFFSLHFQIPYGDFTKGTVGYPKEDEMRKMINMISGDNGLYVAGDDFDCDINSLIAVTEQTRPDIVFLDGLYLIKNKGNDRHSRVSNTADDVKRTAKRLGIPFVTSTQFNREVSDSAADMTLDKIGVSDVIAWNCLSERSIISTPKGMYSGRDLLENGCNSVLDSIGETCCKIVSTGKKELFEVELENGRTIECSSDHKIATLSGMGVCYKEAAELTNEDLVFLGDGNEFGDNIVAGYKSAYKQSYVEIPHIITKGIAELLGYCIGDAWMARDNTWEIAVCNDDPDLTYRIVQILDSEFGYKSKHGDGKTCHMVHLSNKRIIEFYRKIGVELGWKSDTKQIPKGIFSATGNIRRAFLRGYFEADGSVLKTGNIALSTVSRDLAQGTSLLLSSVGINSTIRTASLNQSRDGGYRIWLSLDESIKFSEEIGFMSKRKRSRSVDLCRNSSIKKSRSPRSLSYVRNVINTGITEDMIDIIGTDHGHFIANGIVVHNCDVVYGLFQNENLREDKEMQFIPMKIREGVAKKFYTRWDFDKMDFSETVSEDEVEKFVDNFGGIDGIKSEDTDGDPLF